MERLERAVDVPESVHVPGTRDCVLDAQRHGGSRRIEIRAIETSTRRVENRRARPAESAPCIHLEPCSVTPARRVDAQHTIVNKSG